MNYKFSFYTCAMLAITYSCNCRCVHCSAGLYQKKQDILLSSNEIYLIINQLNEVGINTVYFFGGEPLLDSNLFEYIEYAKKLNMTSRFDTNGMLLNEKTIKKLKESGLSIIGVSLDSPIEENHDKSRGSQGLFRKNIENIINCKKHNLPVYITTIVTKENLYNKELFLMAKLAEMLGVKLRLLSSIQCGLWQDKDEIKLDFEDIINLKKYLKKDKVYWERPDQDFPESSFVCSSLDRSNIYISAYGDVQPCCFIPIAFGNLRNEKLNTILDKMFNSKLYENLNYFDCPVNSVDFRQKTGLDKETKEYPRKY